MEIKIYNGIFWAINGTARLYANIYWNETDMVGSDIKHIFDVELKGCGKINFN